MNALAGDREVVARCPSQADAEKAAGWLLDRLSRFASELVRKRVVSGQAKHPGGAQRSRDGL
jgi:hypothetical protein